MELSKKTSTEIAVEQKQLEESVNTYFASLTSALTEQQKKEFYMLCMLHKLNPLKREIYAVKYGNNFNIITNYYEYLKRADNTGLLEYYNVNVIEKTDKVSGRTVPEKAIFTGKRKDQTKEMTMEFMFNEFTTGTSTWLTKPFFMIDKVAIANGMRRLFPNELGNMPYVNEELWYYNKSNEDIVQDNIKQVEAKSGPNEQDMDEILRKLA